MKPVLQLIVALILFSGLVCAAGGLFNFGTMQQSKLILVEPGKSAVGVIYVFNVHGNRPTHVRAGISEALPSGFTVEILPPLHTTNYTVSGKTMPSEENMVVDPVNISTLPKQMPTSSEPDMEWIPLSEFGFVSAHVLRINVTADKNLPLWKDYDLKVTALANWFDVGEAGPVAIGQSRDFAFTVRTVSMDYSEEQVASPSVSAQPLITEQNLWMYSTIGLVALVVILGAYLFLSKGKKR
ncbi:Uncharacterised protein [Candidatus Norongarragalina meridionalis]|nr:Uncharacterised protein [Candidatus Norongarragalina meridionalis]